MTMSRTVFKHFYQQAEKTV